MVQSQVHRDNHVALQSASSTRHNTMLNMYKNVMQLSLKHGEDHRLQFQIIFFRYTRLDHKIIER